MASQKETYEEVGIVVDVDSLLRGYKEGSNIHLGLPVNKGDKVYFDSWLAAKYPKNEGEFFWLVKYEDVRAIEYAENTLPKFSL